MRILLALAFLLAGCNKTNPNYCPGQPDNACVDGPRPCTMSVDSCVCQLPQGVCVECTVDDERNCTADKPQCGADNRCRQCRANTECASGACLDDGSCADMGRVIYTAAAGAGTAPGCGMAPGQNECSLAEAVAAVTPGGRDVIRLAPGMYTVPSTTVDGLDFSAKSATLIARGATLTRGAPNGAIVSVRNGQTLTLVGGTLLGPSNTTDGIKCIENSTLAVHEVTIDDMIQSGIETNACQLTVARSTIRNNDQGGINMTTASGVTITNNFVYRNGGQASLIGGMTLKLAAGSKLEFNTVVDNTTDVNMATAAGIACEAPLAGMYDAPFNLVYRNIGGIGGQVQVLGTCTFIGSYQQGAAPGANDVGFEAPEGTAPNYRLTAGSPVGTIRDAADCRGLDFERDVRPFPADGKCDYGADEFRTGQ